MSTLPTFSPLIKKTLPPTFSNGPTPTLPSYDLTNPPIAPPAPTLPPTVNDYTYEPPAPVVKGSSLPPFNSQQVYPYDSSSDSATIDVFTGISDIKKLTEIRDRAVYDLNTLSYQPMADSGTGVLFPDAVQAKTIVETTLRVRPTTFKGPKQLDISYDNTDVHFERQIHPRAWRENLTKEWYKGEKNTPFVGYPNPNYYNFYTDSIPTHNVQNLSHAQLTDALRSMGGGDFDHNGYLNSLGSLLKSGAIPYGPAVANIQQVVQTDGGGVNGDPRLAERINAEYEEDFNLSKRIRVADATNDPRFVDTAPGIQYQLEQQNFAENQETQFTQIQEWFGIPTGYSTSDTIRVG